MPEQKEPPRPHGDPLEEEVVERGNADEPNPAQRQSDAPATPPVWAVSRSRPPERPQTPTGSPPATKPTA